MVPYDKTKLIIEKEEQMKLEIQDEEKIIPIYTKIDMLLKYKNLLLSNKIEIKKEKFDLNDKLTILKKCSTNSIIFTNILDKIRYVISLEKDNEYHLIGYPKISQISILRDSNK